MTASASVQWRKEVRELAPWWLGTLATMAACWALMNPDRLPFDVLYTWAVLRDRDSLIGAGVLAYAAGAITLGALSIGQEYAHHTLPQLITQPAARGQVLWMKFVVLAAMLGSMGVLAFVAWGDEGASNEADHVRLAVGLAPVVSGLLLAPWMTMVARGPLGGAVFAAVLPAALWYAGSYFYAPLWLTWTAIIALAATGAAMTWRTFMRLEIAGDHHQEVDPFAWLRRPRDDAQPLHLRKPAWVLLGKELRLQQMTLIASGASIMAWLVVLAGRRLAPDVFLESALYVIGFLHAGLVPLLAGSLASAEERRLRALDWQHLLPVAAWQQWIVKAGVALGLTFILAIVIPGFLETIAAEPTIRPQADPMTLMVLCVAALYVSSLNVTGLRALLATLPAIALAVLFYLMVLWPAVTKARYVADPAINVVASYLQSRVPIDGETFFWWRRHGIEWVAAGLGLLLVSFAFMNHRTSDTSRSRLVRQVAWLSAYAMAATLLFILVSAMFGILIRSRPPGRPIGSKPGISLSSPSRQVPGSPFTERRPLRPRGVLS